MDQLFSCDLSRDINRLLCGKKTEMVFIPTILILNYIYSVNSEGEEPIQKCYSCSSPQLHLRWPKSEDNKLQFLHDFPWFANESCDQVRNNLPVVDCPGSVCIKAVIKEPPAKREVCVEGGAIIRDCWSRVMHLSEGFSLMPPKTKKDYVRLTETIDGENTLGYIYTCQGYLCNSANYKHSLLILMGVVTRLLIRL